jgi:hypothetical protein
VSSFVPELQVQEIGGRVRLALRGFSFVEGSTLQDAADELVHRMLLTAMALRSSGLGPIYPGAAPDVDALAFVWRLGEVAAAGGDIRSHLFGTGSAEEAIGGPGSP